MEDVLRRIWHLLKLGYSSFEIKRVLQLLSNVSWSSHTVEQAHVHASVLICWHKHYSAATLRRRSRQAYVKALNNQVS